MTQMGLDYLRHQEQRRSNLANETETNRANIAKETENLRHNTATEQQARDELAETNRHNVRTETLEDIKNAAIDQHYQRQDANQLKVAQIKADTDIEREKLSNATKEKVNANDNQTKRMTELTKLLPGWAQQVVAKAYAKEDPVFQKSMEEFQKAKGSAKGKAKEALITAALNLVNPSWSGTMNVLRWKDEHGSK